MTLSEQKSLEDTLKKRAKNIQLVHTILKIKYVNLGYIKKNYPYHLISDEEMFNAFIDLGDTEFNAKTTMIDPEVRFFEDYYPNPFAEEDYIYQKKNSSGEVIEEISLSDEYTRLKAFIISEINDYLAYKGTSEEYQHLIPSWVYTYMLGEVIYQQSEYLDIQDLLVLLNCFNIDNIFTREACITCYMTSLKYITTLNSEVRPPTVFGEPHIIKVLRMET